MFKGISLAFFSSIFFSLTTVIVKYMSNTDASQMAFARFVGITMFIFPVALEHKGPIFGPVKLRYLLLLRGIFGATSLYLRYSSLHYLSIANATVIVLSMPVFVCIFAKIFLKEPCGIFHVVALAITFVGILFTSKIDKIIANFYNNEAFNTKNELLGLLYSLGATIIGSLVYVIVRKVKDIHYSTILFNFAWVALLESIFISYVFHDGLKLPKGIYEPWLMMILSLLSFYGQLLLTQALQLEEAALISVTRSAAEVFFAFIFQITIFQDVPTLTSVIGSLLITSAVMLTSLRKWISTLPDTHKAKQILWFILK